MGLSAVHEITINGLDIELRTFKDFKGAVDSGEIISQGVLPREIHVDDIEMLVNQILTSTFRTATGLTVPRYAEPEISTVLSDDGMVLKASMLLETL